jgi:hypothetical protein
LNTTQKIRVVLAFDHELSLGGASDYDRNLFEPTTLLLDAAEALGVRIALFTDVLCAIMHERWGEHKFVERYRSTLSDAIVRGHDVQLHLHPHWITSSWISGAFVPSHDFALGAFADRSETESIEGIIALGAAYLRELGVAADRNYRCVAFRAGGYNLEPGTARILHALYAQGIRIDSSIIKGFRFVSGISAIDFTAMPASANWFLPLDGPLKGTGPKGMFEVPIASAPRTPLNNLPFLARRALHRRRRHQDGGRGIHEAATGRFEKLQRLFPKSAWPLSFDNHADGGREVFEVLRRHVKAHAFESEIICASVSHPKSMGAHARRVFREFVERARDAYGDSLTFETYSGINAALPAQAVAAALA